jgi:hypothetical protein
MIGQARPANCVHVCKSPLAVCHHHPTRGSKLTGASRAVVHSATHTTVTSRRCAPPHPVGRHILLSGPHCQRPVRSTTNRSSVGPSLARCAFSHAAHSLAYCSPLPYRSISPLHACGLHADGSAHTGQGMVDDARRLLLTAQAHPPTEHRIRPACLLHPLTTTDCSCPHGGHTTRNSYWSLARLVNLECIQEPFMRQQHQRSGIMEQHSDTP